VAIRTEGGHTPYIPTLDGWRALSVLIVLVSHAGFGHLVPGGLGVTIFFFISGYLITSLLQVEFEDRATIHIQHFYLRRFFRLSPTLMATLFLVYGVTALGLHPGGISWSGAISQVFYFANYQDAVFPGEHGLTPLGTSVLWSLAIEEHFYLLYPGLLGLLLRRFSAKQTAAVFAALCMGILLWRWHLATSGDMPLEHIYYRTDARIDSMLFGCILALAFQPMAEGGQSGSADMPGILHWGLMAAGLMLMLVSLLVRDPVFRETLRYSLQGLALMPIFYCGIKWSAGKPFSWLDAAWLSAIGKRSYAIYLSHFIIMHSLLAHTALKMGTAGMVIAALLLALLYAELIDRWVEPYFKRLRARYR